MSVLVTGASGFIGSRVLTELQKRYTDESIFVLSSQLIQGVINVNSKNYNFDENYLFNSGCESVDTIYHVGAWTPHETKFANNVDGATGNIFSTIKLLKSRLPNLKKVIYCSSIDVYGNVEDVINEETIATPLTLYGLSKLYCEKIVETLAQEQRLTFQILRIGHVYGEGEESYRKVMPVMIENAIKGQKLKIYGDGEATRSYIYIDDVVDLIIKSRTLETSNVINIAGDMPISINELARLLQQFSGNEIDIEHIYTEDKNRNYIFNVSRMKDLFNVTLTKFNDGLKKEYSYMRSKLLN